MTAIGIALEALEQIAARGILSVNTLDKAIEELSKDDNAQSPVCPRCGPVFGYHAICMCGEFQCSECREFQPSAGPCLNRDCASNIARRAIDDIRRAL